MNWKAILKIQGFLLIIISISMIFALIVSLYFQSGDANAIIIGIVITFVVGVILTFLKSGNTLQPKEGFIIVSLGWIFASAFGAIPFYLHGSMGTFIDCFFETMSGFTTTGATILTNIEAMPEGLLFWRSLTHWLGGMGIILLTIALLPILGLSSLQLFKAEVPGPTKDRISPKIKDTAKILWFIYSGMTVLETILLMLGGMNLYEALSHTFSTLATGGFSTLNSSIAGFNNLYIEIVIIFFMYLAGINFALHFHLIRGNIKTFFKNKEWQFYTLILIGGIIVITLNIHFANYDADYLIKNPELKILTDSIFQSLRYATFQVVSITTTTGFATANFDLWPEFSRMLLIILMFIGGSAGSTGGGMKQIRIMVTLKHMKNEIKKLIYPNRIFSIKIGKEAVPDFVIKNILAFVFTFIIIFVGLTLFISFMGYDIITSFSTAIATLGNIGPGLARVGAIENYAFFDQITKLVLSFAMMLGRLELYSVLILVYYIFSHRPQIRTFKKR
ncbi:MAG: potassium transporter TrkG [Candidatus Marinimicrobia bacterium]|nr:potassium transporter TrkG [Candidatus Neomarinimicrobiota bacterium]